MWEGHQHDLVEALDTAQAAHIVDEIEDGYSFRHPLLHEVMYYRMPSALRRRLHMQAARTLEKLYRGQERVHAADLLRHYLIAEDAERALHYALSAGSDATVSYAQIEAHGFFQTALQLAQELGDRGREAEAQIGLGRALHHLSRYQEALVALEAALVIRSDLGDMEGQRQVVALMAWVHEARGTLREGTALVESALQSGRSPEASPAVFSLHEVVATLLERAGRADDALTAAEQSGEVAHTIGNSAMMARAAGRRGYILNSLGRAEEALAVLEPIVPRLESTGDLDALRRALNNIAHIYSGLGDPTRARSFYEAALQAARRTGNIAAVAAATVILGREALHRGDFEQALQYCSEGIAMAEASGDMARLVDGHWWLTEYDFWQNTPRAVLTRMEPLLSRSDLQADLRFDLLLPLARAHGDIGNGLRAKELAAEALAWARAEADPIDLLDALVVHGRIESQHGLWDQAERTFEEALALADGLPHGRYGKFRSLGHARALEEFGLACAQRGRRDRATGLLEAALVIFQHLGVITHAQRTQRALMEFD
jgi:tetratricopeptide (TPR) repeat protein